MQQGAGSEAYRLRLVPMMVQTKDLAAVPAVNVAIVELELNVQSLETILDVANRHANDPPHPWQRPA